MFDPENVLQMIKDKKFDPKIIIKDFRMDSSKRIILRSNRDKSKKDLHDTFRRAKRDRSIFDEP